MDQTSCQQQPVLKRIIANSVYGRLTRDRGASTIIRLFKSRHVADLQLIFYASVFVTLLVVGVILWWPQLFGDNSIVSGRALVSAIVAACFGVLVWAYQTGSQRLGVVDLFACEIITVCRITTISDAIRLMIEMAGKPPATPKKFCSEEQYTPVFASNSKDLEVLEARTIEPVAEFYTYLKVSRDYLRILGTIDKPREDAEIWRNGVRNVIYMFFLMLESARASIERLVEYQPERMQNTITITIFLSELTAFRYLLDSFEAGRKSGRPGAAADGRLGRLRLRSEKYLKLGRDLHDTTKKHESDRGPDRERWGRALVLLDDLNHRYYETFDKWLDPNVELPRAAE